MRTNLLTILSVLTIASIGLYGCDDGDGMDAGPGVDSGPLPDVDAGPGDDDAGPGDVDAGPGAQPLGMANPPTPGTQIDRAGRPGITTALIGTFVLGDGTVGDENARNALKDSYNADTDPSTWGASYTDVIANNLAIIDAIDPTAPMLPATRCGNQLLAGATPTADRYDALAGVLANDWLVVNTTSGTCDAAGYLGAEAEFLGAVADGGCGGRIPEYDVIARTYSVLVNGTIDNMIDDGIGPTDEDGAHDNTTFPFLGPAL